MAGLKDQITSFKDIPVWIFVVIFLAIIAMFYVMYLLIQKKKSMLKEAGAKFAKEQKKK